MIEPHRLTKNEIIELRKKEKIIFTEKYENKFNKFKQKQAN
jgi:hypothetical protein